MLLEIVKRKSSGNNNQEIATHRAALPPAGIMVCISHPAMALT